MIKEHLKNWYSKGYFSRIFKILICIWLLVCCVIGFVSAVKSNSSSVTASADESSPTASFYQGISVSMGSSIASKTGSYSDTYASGASGTLTGITAGSYYTMYVAFVDMPYSDDTSYVYTFEATMSISGYTSLSNAVAAGNSLNVRSSYGLLRLGTSGTVTEAIQDDYSVLTYEYSSSGSGGGTISYTVTTSAGQSRAYAFYLSFYVASSAFYYNFDISYSVVADYGDYASAYQAGFDAGYTSGYSSGQSSVNLSPTYNNGYNDGYSTGYYDGVEQASNYTFLSLMSAVVSAPVTVLDSILNFEILGVNLSSFFYGLLSVMLVLAIIKLLMGFGS